MRLPNSLLESAVADRGPTEPAQSMCFTNVPHCTVILHLVALLHDISDSDSGYRQEGADEKQTHRLSTHAHD